MKTRAADIKRVTTVGPSIRWALVSTIKQRASQSRMMQMLCKEESLFFFIP